MHLFVFSLTLSIIVILTIAIAKIFIIVANIRERGWERWRIELWSHDQSSPTMPGHFMLPSKAALVIELVIFIIIIIIIIIIIVIIIILVNIIVVISTVLR